MQYLWAAPFFRQRYPWAIATGLLWTAAFPNIGLAGAAWLAPGLMIACALGKQKGDVFRIGYISGLAHYLSLLYWLLFIPYRWHRIPFGPALGWLALSGFLALFPALWVWLVAPAQSTNETRVHGRPEQTAGGVLARNWIRRTVWTISGAAVWVGLEMVLARIFGGFPWALLGVSQYPLTPLIQAASVTGVYGLSFLAVWISLALLSAALLMIRRPTQRSVWVAEVFLPLLTVALVFNAGFRHLSQETPPARTLKTLLVQPSIPQTLIWDASGDAERFRQLAHLTEQALTNKAELLIWPESAVPKMLRYDTNIFEMITGLARRHHLWMIVGSDDAEPRRNATKPQEEDYFNSSFLISPEGRLMERYVKRNLVIFGEYVPLTRWLPFLSYFTPIQGGYTPGTHGTGFHLKSLEADTSVLICFEDVFPELAQQDVTPDTDFLVNITNDGWFDRSAAQWQHGVSGLFRAVENGVPLIRCSNNGLTCWIDEKGRLRDFFRDEKGTIYGRGFLRVDLPLPVPGQKHALTFYTEHGDVFGWGCVGIGCILVLRRVLALIWRKKAETLGQNSGSSSYDGNLSTS